MYTVVRDRHGWFYVIPHQKLDDWNRWSQLNPEDEATWDLPDWADPLNDGVVVFPIYAFW